MSVVAFLGMLPFLLSFAVSSAQGAPWQAPKGGTKCALAQGCWPTLLVGRKAADPFGSIFHLEITTAKYSATTNAVLNHIHEKVWQLMANEPLEKLGFKDIMDEKSEAKPEKL